MPPLSAAITSYLEDKGIEGARLLESIIILPTENGEIHRRISGEITSAKLDSLIAEYQEKQNA